MILLLDCSAMTVHMTLIDEDRCYDYTWDAERQLARQLLSYLRDRLAEHGADFTDLTGIGVFRGPGSYTGLRIGLTVLNTLADAQRIPIVGSVDSDWRADCQRRLNAHENDQIVLPEYGGDAHVTKPRK